MAQNPALGMTEYELSTCDDCGRSVFVEIGRSGTEILRDVNGARHVCGNTGSPLLRSGISNLEALGSRPADTLRK